VPVSTLAEALPYVNWITLVTLGVGAFAFVALIGAITDATNGYLRFTSVTAGVIAALAFLSDSGLPVPTELAIKAPPSDLDALRTAALGGFVVMTFVYGVILGRPRTRLVAAALGFGLSMLALIAAAAGWAPTAVDAVPLAVQLGSLSAVTGGSMAAIALGHWYLVTPKLSERPLTLEIRMLLASLMVQALLFVVWTTLGGGVDQRAWEALSGPSALLVWLRGGITILFPIILVYMALRTALTRSMESATGLLYINLAAVLAGTIGAAALYVSTGLLV
jgi:hypothetical protein